MRRPLRRHRDRGWRVHQLTRDYELLDVWEYPIQANERDFETFLETHDLEAMVAETSLLVRALFWIRAVLGRVFRWDDSGSLFEEVLRTDRELALRARNRTVTALLHLGWIRREDGSWTAELAVLAIPQGRLGRAYLAAIAPFRHWAVYPALMRAGRRRWERRSASRS